MADQSTQKARTVQIKTVVVASSRKRVQRPSAIRPFTPTTKSSAEKEAEQWVAAMMFERYNS